MKNMQKISSVTQLCIYIWCIVGILNAQPENIRFEQLNNANNLSQNWVHDICQDKYGFIWIGTEGGLNRYDGYDFSIYRHNRRDSNSLSNNAINSLFEDSRGNLWVGTSGGLNLYDRENDKFIRKTNGPRNIIYDIVEDKQNNLWLATNDGLYHLNITTDSVTVFIPNNPVVLDKGYLSSNVIQTLIIDSDDNIWAGSNKGLNLFDPKNNSVINYYHDDNNPNSISNDDVRSIVEDNKGRIWIGTNAGLNVLTNVKERSAKGNFIRFENNSHDQHSISSGRVLDLMMDKENKLWIGIENSGLDILDLDSFNKGMVNFNHYRSNPNKTGGLGINSIYTLYQDRQGIIWIGTFGKGVNVVNPIGNKFALVAHEVNNENSLSNNNVNTFFEEKDFLWIGTEGGLNRYDKRTGTFKHFGHNPADPASIGSNAVWAIRKDRRGNLWVGTWGGGLNLFNYKTETFARFTNNPQNINSIGSNNIFSIIEDRSGKIWLGTMGGGVNVFDSETKQFTRYNDTTSNISSNYAQAVIETKNGEIWLINILALERFDKTTKQFEHFRHNENDTTSLSGIRPLCVFEDSKENIWVGTDEGLNVLNKKSKAFTTYRIDNGLPSNFIISILEDEKGNLWIGTNRGLSEFVNAVNLPEKPEFKNYTVEDGLQANEFTRRSCYKSTDGSLYFGGVNGFTMFNPDKISANTFIPPVIITSFNIFNKPVQVGEDGSPLKKNIIFTDDLTLSYKHSVFSFEFVALNYSAAAKNQYAYMMEGFDHEWNYVGTKRTATYTNLDPGEYVFRVKGSNNDGVWNEQGASIHIVITPPFWQTLWFKLIFAVIVISIGILTYRRLVHARKLAEEHRIEQALAKERNLLRTVIDNLPDGIFVKDLKSRKTLANRADVYNTGNKTEDEVLGKDDYELFPKEMAEGFIADDRAVMQTGKPVINREEFVIDAQGQKHYLLTTKLPFRNEQGQIIGLIGIGRDITQRKLAEEALSQKTALLEAQLNSSIDGVLVVDNQGKKILQNQRTVELWKIPKEIADNPNDQLQVDHVMNLTKDPDQFVRQVKYLYDHLNESSRDEIELKDGTVLDRYSAPVIGNDGQNYGRIWSFRDITEKKLAEEALKGERNLLRTLIDNMPDYVYVKDAEGRFIVGNAATARQLGFASEVELLGKTDFDIFPPELAEKYHTDEQKILETGKGIYEFEGPTIDTKKEQKDRWISTTKVPFRDTNGNILGTVGIGRDITERKRIEEEREILISELQNALADVKVLKGLVPICSNCKKIRDDSGFWNQLESYIQKHSQAKFSHGICPECMTQLYPDIHLKTEKGKEEE